MLLLRPPVADAPRLIVDAASGTAVGFARWQPAPEGGWWGWLLGPVLHVHEQEDAPLIFTVRCCCWRWLQREVRDAEGERVGYLTGGFICDRGHRVYAKARILGAGTVYEYVRGELLASTLHTPQGLELAFTKLIDGDPFAKMLLLAAALCQE